MAKIGKDLFDVQTSTIGSEFIRIQEECEERKPFYVVDNSRVPDKPIAGMTMLVYNDSGEAMAAGALLYSFYRTVSKEIKMVL